MPAFALGAAIPLGFFLWRQRSWRRTLREQLPDAFYLLARSLRSGRSIEQGFQQVGVQGAPPLSQDFARMSRQLELGLALGPVLQNTARRIELVDFNVFASVLNLHRTTGGNLPAVLDRLAAMARDQNQFDRQYQAATVLGRYSAAFIGVMVAFILFYLFFFQRDWAAAFFETTLGICLFAAALALEVIGAALLYWFMRRNY